MCPSAQLQRGRLQVSRDFLGNLILLFPFHFRAQVASSSPAVANMPTITVQRKSGEMVRGHIILLLVIHCMYIKYSSSIPVTKESGWAEIVCLPSCCLSGVVSTERWRQLLWLPWPGALLRPAPQPPGDIEMEQIQETGILRTPRKLARGGAGGKRCQS